MPAKIVLLLCMLFIFFIFRLDIKQKSNVSSALWVPLIWFMIAGSRPLGYWLNRNPIMEGEIDPIAGDPINSSFLSMLIVIGLFILFRRKLGWSHILKSNKWIIILLLYVTISILWSDYMFVSFKRLIRVFGDMIMVLIVLTEHDPLAAIERMFRRFSYVIIPLSIVVSKYFPNIGVVHTRWGGHTSWVGLTTDKNSLGIVACISASFFLWNTIKRYRNSERFIDIVLLLMSLFLLFYGKAQSATALFVFFLGIGIFIALSKFKSNPERIVKYFILIVFIILLLVPVYVYTFETILDLLGRDITLTNRTVLWQRLIEISSSRPIFGSGYASFWIEIRDHNMWNDFAYVFSQAHNGYIDVYLQIGIVGVFLLIVSILVTYKSIIKEFIYNFEYCIIRMTLLTMIVFHNITEASFLRGTSFVWFLFVLVTITVSRRYNPITPHTLKTVPLK